MLHSLLLYDWCSASLQPSFVLLPAALPLFFFLPLPVPAGIYGILLLLLLLTTGILKVGQIKEVSSFLIEIMPVMFIPAAAGLMQSYHLLAPSLAAYAVIIVVSTIAVMVVSGRVTQRIILRKNREDNSNG